MSEIIKSARTGEHASVRPIAALYPPAPRVPTWHEEECERLNRRLLAVQDELARRDETITSLRGDVEQAFVKGREEGHQLGIAAAEDRQTERLLVLENAAHQAVANVADGVASLERLSALLARDCLDIILGRSDDRTGMVRKIIEVQIAKIDKSMILTVEVSREDFPDTKALAVLSRQFGNRTKFSTNAELPSGGCTMRLRLGSLEIGIDQQWGALRDLLEEMAMPEEMA